MKATKRRILFFTPYATRTGSEVLIYYILKHLDRTRYEAALVSFSYGEMIPELPDDIPVFYVPRNFKLKDKIAYHLGWHPIYENLKRIHKKYPSDIWYVNTIMMPEVVKVAQALGQPVITHVHELSAMYTQISRNDFETIIHGSTALLGCSEAVCKGLREAGAKDVSTLHSFVDLSEIAPSSDRVQQLREQWGAGSDDFVWIMSGTSSERKGFDLLPELAAHYPERTSVHFVWVGKLLDDGLTYLTEQRCRHVSNVKIHLVGAQKKDYYAHLAAADGFMLTSRQEPFGMVLVEAAWLGKPIVSFDSGGPAEFVDASAGVVVPALEIKSFVEAMQTIERTHRSHDKEASRQLAQQYSVEQGVSQWNQLLDTFYNRHIQSSVKQEEVTI
jgi:glycosyltransferase involved in cell wall biosynthesis